MTGIWHLSTSLVVHFHFGLKSYRLFFFSLVCNPYIFTLTVNGLWGAIALWTLKMTLEAFFYNHAFCLILPTNFKINSTLVWTMGSLWTAISC